MSGLSAIADFIRNSPKTPAERLRSAARELGFEAIRAKYKFGRYGAYVLVPRLLGPGVNETYLVHFTKRGVASFRSLEESRSQYLKNIEAIERIAKIPCQYLPLTHAINAITEHSMPGGWYAWWELCDKNALLALEIQIGPIDRTKPVRRVHKVLHDALKEPEQGVPKLIPRARDYHRLPGNLLHRKRR